MTNIFVLQVSQHKDRKDGLPFAMEFVLAQDGPAFTLISNHRKPGILVGTASLLEEEVFDDRANKAMAWGTEHEDDAVKVIIDTIPGCTFYESPFIPHPDYDWLKASPDGLIKVDDDNGHWEANVEIKCVGTNCLDKGYEAMAKELKKKTKPSPWYMSQIHMEMAVQIKRKHSLSCGRLCFAGCSVFNSTMITTHRCFF